MAPSTGRSARCRGFAIDGVDLPGNGGFGNEGVFRVITWSPMAEGRRFSRAR